MKLTQIKLNKMLVFEGGGGGEPEYPEKNLSEQTREHNKLNPHMTPNLGIEPGPHCWEAIALTTAPSLRHHHCSKDEPHVGQLDL